MRGAALLTFVRLIDSKIHAVCHYGSLGYSPGPVLIQQQINLIEPKSASQTYKLNACITARYAFIHTALDYHECTRLARAMYSGPGNQQGINQNRTREAKI